MDKSKVYIYKITSGMMSDFEVIKTNAPKEIVEKQLKIICEQEGRGEVEENVYKFIEEKGYIIDVIDWTLYEDIEDIKIDYYLDYYDYYED